MKIWQRDIILSFVKPFFLYLFCFYLLYSFLDYASHMQHFVSKSDIPIGASILFYLFQFIKRIELLLPLAFLLALIKVLTDMNRNHELLALQASGLTTRKILTPLWGLAFMTSLLLALSFQFLHPFAINYTSHFSQTYLKTQEIRNDATSSLQTLPLDDGSYIVFQTSNEDHSLFEDIFYIVSKKKIYHMKSLDLRQKVPTGYGVDLLISDEKGAFEMAKSYPRKTFTRLHLEANEDFSPLFHEHRSLSELFHLAQSHRIKAPLLTHLYHKIALCLMPPLLLFVMLPSCWKFRRHDPLFAIYAAGLFGFMLLYTLISSSVILGESQALSPFIAIFTLPLLLVSFYSYKYLRGIS